MLILTLKVNITYYLKILNVRNSWYFCNMWFSFPKIVLFIIIFNNIFLDGLKTRDLIQTTETVTDSTIGCVEETTSSDCIQITETTKYRSKYCFYNNFANNS